MSRHRLNVWDRIAGHCFVAGAVVFLLVVTSASFAATAPIRSGPDPQFLQAHEAAKAAAVIVPVTWSSYAGRRIQPCPGTRDLFSDLCREVPPVREADHATQR